MKTHFLMKNLSTMKSPLSPSFLPAHSSLRSFGVDRFRLLLNGWGVKVLSLLLVVMVVGVSWGQQSISGSTAVTEDFSSMSSTVGATLPTGFKIGTDWASGTTVTTQALGTTGSGAVASNSGGGAINWANGVTASSTDRSLGFLSSSSYSSPRSIIYAFINNTGSTVNSISLSWSYEKSRSGSRAFDWTFFHGSTSTASTAATSGNQSFPADASNTVISNPPLSTSKSVTISNLAITDGSTYYLRWTYTGNGGSTNAQGLSIDDFTITLGSTPAPEINIKQSTTSYSSGGTFDFGNQVSGTNSSTTTFTIENLGTANLTLSGSPKVAISGTNASEFTVNEGSTSATIAAGGNTTYTITFSPTSQGAKSAQLSIANNDATGSENPYLINLTGTGTVSSTSDIINNSAYNYSSNIDYVSYQTTSSLTTGNSVGVNGLTIRDGGATADADDLGTTLTGLTFTTGGSTAIRRAALFDGLTNIAEVAVNGATTISFTGLSLSALDGGTKDFELRVSYQNTVTDNQQISYSVSAASSSSTGSIFTNSNAGGATSSTSFDINKLEVTATSLAYTQQPQSSISEFAIMTPAVALIARDINSNTDLDYSSTVSLAITTGSTTFDGSATINGVFSAGVVSLGNLVFNFPSISNKISATSGALTIESTAFDVTTSLPEINIKQGATSYLTSSAFAFGNQVSGTNSSTTTFTIENLGTANLILSGSPKVAISGTNASEFTVNETSTTSPVAAGGNTTYTITFSPTSQGAKSAQLSIANNDATGSENPYLINLTGTGTVSSASDIINNSAYSYSSNIDYATYQTTTSLTTGNSVGVNGLTIRDGGATADADNLGTTLTGLTFTTGGSTAIRTAALFDGSTNIAEVPVNGASTISFTGLSLNAADGGTKDFELRVSYQSTVTDNQQITYSVSAATSTNTGSNFTTTSAGAAVSSNTADRNRIKVTVSQLVFSQQPTAVNTNVSMSPSVTVTAKDVFNNIDLDFSDIVRISSTGTMTNSPVSAAAVSGVATFSSLTHTASGSGLTLLAERNNNNAWDLDVSSATFTVTLVSSSTDYFRSAATGTWATASSWESSADGTTNWITATLAPNNNANTVIIRNGHTITNSSSVTIDQVIVQNGGILTLATGGAATIANGSGDDVVIQDGGRINYQFAPIYSSSTIRINGGGILSIEVSGVTGNGAGVNATTHIYDNAAILQWNFSTGIPSSSNVTYFPNVTAEIPIFRFASGTQTSLWGAGNPTIVNGIVEISDGITINLTGTASKTFKYGIAGAGTLNQGTAGQIIFSGSTAEVGGTSKLVLGTSGLSVSSNLSVTGTIDCGANIISGSGSFNLSSGATLKTAHVSGIAGAITTTNKTFSSLANYEFNGAVTGTFTTTPTANTVNDLTINKSSGVVTLSQYLKTNGALTLTSGTLDIVANTLTLAGSVSRTNGNIDADAGTVSFGNSAHLSLPTSLFSGNIYNLSKASGAGTVTLIDDLTVTNELTSAASTGAIIIPSSKVLTVSGTGKATINGTLTNNGTFTLNSGATLLQGDLSSISGGAYNVKQNITGAGSGTPSGRFWYVGSPVSGATSAVYDAAGANILKYYSESANAWQEITDNTSSLEVGRGYFVQAATGTTELNFTGGTINNNTYILNVSRNTTTNAFRGYNLLTNPYPSYLDWDNVTRSNVGTTMWYRAANSGGTMVFDTYNVSAGTGTNNNGAGVVTNFIPPMQSFWVNVPQGQTSGTVSFGNDQRSHYSTGVQGLRSTAQDFPAFLRLNLLDGSFVDQTILYMKPAANNTFDEYDSEKMFLGGVPQFYSTVNAKKLVLNGMKNQKARTSVPLTMELPTSKSYTFQAEEFNIEDGLILLEDKQEGVIQDLTINPTYSFFGNAGTNATRFVVHFQLATAPVLVGGPQELESLGSDELTTDNIQIVSNNQGTVIVRLDEGFKPEGSIRIFDASGRLVEQTDFNDQETTIQLKEQAGMYFVEVSAGKLMVKKKIVIE
jgi:hypothetical protein